MRRANSIILAEENRFFLSPIIENNNDMIEDTEERKRIEDSNPFNYLSSDYIKKGKEKDDKEKNNILQEEDIKRDEKDKENENLEQKKENEEPAKNQKKEQIKRKRGRPKKKKKSKKFFQEKNVNFVKNIIMQITLKFILL